MKIIFLDFDGVITHPESGWRIDQKKVKLVEKIIKATDAKIVISSSWAIGSKDAEAFIKHNLSEKLLNTLFAKSIFSVVQQARYWDDSRGQQIERWLNEHENEVENYVILDDDSDMLESQLFNFVQTDTFFGMSDRTVDLAVKILNNKRIEQPVRLNMELMLRWYERNAGRESNIDDLLDEYYKKNR